MGQGASEISISFVVKESTVLLAMAVAHNKVSADSGSFKGGEQLQQRALACLRGGKVNPTTVNNLSLRLEIRLPAKRRVNWY